MKISSQELNAMLFEQIQSLMEAETAEEVELEVKRSKAVAQVAGEINKNTANAVKAFEISGGQDEKRIDFIE
jgi:hypothetical protein